MTKKDRKAQNYSWKVMHKFDSGNSSFFCGRPFGFTQRHLSNRHLYRYVKQELGASPAYLFALICIDFGSGWLQWSPVLVIRHVMRLRWRKITGVTSAGLFLQWYNHMPPSFHSHRHILVSYLSVIPEDGYASSVLCHTVFRFSSDTVIYNDLNTFARASSSFWLDF